MAATLKVSKADSFSAQRRLAISALREAEYESRAINAATASLGDNSRTLKRKRKMDKNEFLKIYLLANVYFDDAVESN